MNKSLRRNLVVLVGCFTLTTLGLSTGAFAQEKSKSASRASVADSFRCERMRNKKLKEIKAQLVANCNLDKPFSISTTDIAVDTDATYCCHTLEGE